MQMCGISRIFQSTLPARGATKRSAPSTSTQKFQSTLPARGATRCPHIYLVCIEISIHAPRTGSDGCSTAGQHFRVNFNPRSPHGERPCRVRRYAVSQGFQSTLPARGATVHAGRGQEEADAISIHAPRTGSDVATVYAGTGQGHFNPRSPHGERLAFSPSFSAASSISIHAPRTGSDRHGYASVFSHAHFNPRSPHGERPPRTITRGVTRISIHAPRTGSDFHRPDNRHALTSFQSTLPARGATCPRRRSARRWYFNPRSPHGERRHTANFSRSSSVFQSTLPARGATCGAKSRAVLLPDFNPRSPHGERRYACLFRAV